MVQGRPLSASLRRANSRDVSPYASSTGPLYASSSGPPYASSALHPLRSERIKNGPPYRLLEDEEVKMRPDFQHYRSEHPFYDY